jgi:Tfp pilus assembly protein PilV
VRMSHAGHPPRRSAGQAGLSLVESIITVLLASVVVLALAGAMLTLITTSRATSDAQRIQAALTSYTESLKAAPYVACPVAGQDVAQLADDYEQAASTWTPPAAAGPEDVVTVGIDRIEFWEPAAGAAPTAGRFRTTCPTADGGAQRISVTVTRGGQSVSGQTVVRPA